MAITKPQNQFAVCLCQKPNSNRLSTAQQAFFVMFFLFFCKGLFVDIYNKCHIHHRKQWWVFVKSVIAKMDLVAVVFQILSIISSLSNQWQLLTIEYSTQSLLYIYWQLEIDENEFNNDIPTILTNKQRNCHHIRHYTLFQWIITK